MQIINLNKRIKQDMLYLLKSIHGFDIIDIKKGIIYDHSINRGHDGVSEYSNMTTSIPLVKKIDLIDGTRIEIPDIKVLEGGRASINATLTKKNKNGYFVFEDYLLLNFKYEVLTREEAIEKIKSSN